MALALVLAASLLVMPDTADALFGIDLFNRNKTAKPSEIIPDPVIYSATLNTPGASKDLEKTIKQASRMTGDDTGPVSGAVGLIAAASNEQRRLIGALYAGGYYGGTVDIALAGQPFQDIPVDKSFASGVVPVVITVNSGPRFDFGAVSISGNGPVQIDPERFGIRSGEPARSTEIMEAGDAIVEAEREKGRPLARIVERKVVADHATKRLDVAITVDPGPPAVFGAVSVTGTERMRSDFVVRYADIPVGAPYSPKVLAKARRRLQDLGVFDSVIVATGDEVAADGSIPVIITVSERPRRVIGAGVTVSNTEGAGVEAYWGHRNLFGGAESIRLEGSVARIGDGTTVADHDFGTAIVFSKPGAFGPSTRLNVRVFALHERPDAFERSSAGGSVGVEKQVSETLTGIASVGAEWSDTDDAFGDNTSVLTFVKAEGVWDSRDNPLDPTTGFRVAASVAPHVDLRNGASFVVSRASLSAYRALDEANRLVLAGRVATGTILGAANEDIPASRRFFSGGGGSVRGYAFQALGPRNASGEPTGGRAFAEASVEARFRVTERIGVVPFFDIGTVSANATPGDEEWFAGAGVGVRYSTPVGPIRLDVAIPLTSIEDEPDFGVYLGIGQAF